MVNFIRKKEQRIRGREMPFQSGQLKDDLESKTTDLMML